MAEMPALIKEAGYPGGDLTPAREAWLLHCSGRQRSLGEDTDYDLNPIM